MTISAVGKEWRKNKPLDIYLSANCTNISKTMEVPQMAKKEIETSSVDGYEEVGDTIFKFEKIGDELDGQFVAQEAGKSFGNQVYKISKNGRMFSVFSTTVLESRMKGVKIGDFVMIKYVADIPNKNKNLHDVKDFKVFIKKA